MKPIFFATLFLFLVFSAKSQIEKGAFMAEGGVKLGNNSILFPEGFDISIRTNDEFWKDTSTGIDRYSRGSRNLGFSLSPRFGYSVFQNFVLGIDLKYVRDNFNYSPFTKRDKGYNQGKGYGFFARKYFGSKKFTPFVEAEFGFWTLKYFDSTTSPGGGVYGRSEIDDKSYWGGAIGCSYSICSNFKMNLLAKLQHSRETYSNFSGYKVLSFDSALVLSFSYFLKSKSKQ